MNKKQLLIIFFLGINILLSAQDKGYNKQQLNEGWTFRQYNLGKWYDATVPGTVHTDLLHNELIKDPFFRVNEQEVQWIDKVNWEYKMHFSPDENILNSDNQILTFYGLDTYADIFLNGEQIGSVNNMFRTWKFDVKGKLTAGKNELNIVFFSPISKGLEEMERYGLALPADNDYSQYGGMGKVRVSVYTRKAPYHYGWDWGPRLVPSGIWRPVVLEGWNKLKIDDVFIKQNEVSKSQALLEAEITLQSDTPSDIKIEISHKGKLLSKLATQTQTGENKISLPFSIKNPKLWWSNGLGAPNLYDFDISIKEGQKTVAKRSLTTGLRSLKLVRNKDEKGESFYFELNGVAVFAKGTNSIPNDIFLPRISRQDYEKMVKDVARANMNMIRIWGGGIYEDDYFYELCDRHGIMVWQDFMFACAMYPGNKEFLDNVRAEAIDNIIRLRNHPSIALWCGNNEIDVAWARWGWKRRYTEDEQKRIFDAYVELAHQLLPELVGRYTDGDDYWPSSPMSGPGVGEHEQRPANSGDNHYWGVWFEQHKFNQYDENIGRFISEYGFQSFPEFSTVKTYAIPEDYTIESEIMMAHQRSQIGNQRIKEYMSWYYDVPEDFEQFLYMSQVLQAKAMRGALHAHRRNMPYCMGSLIWQLNDCWPVASWSTTDYFHNWKASHYAVRDACKPVIIVPREINDKLELWVINDRLNKLFQPSYSIRILDFSGRELKRISGTCSAAPNTSQLIATQELAALLGDQPLSSVMAVISLYEGKNLIDRQHHYFSEPKNLSLPERPEIKRELITKGDKKFIRVSSDKLACDVMFYTEEGVLSLADNYLDLLPGETYELEVLNSPETLSSDNIKVRYIQ